MQFIVFVNGKEHLVNRERLWEATQDNEDAKALEFRKPGLEISASERLQQWAGHCTFLNLSFLIQKMDLKYVTSSSFRVLSLKVHHRYKSALNANVTADDPLVKFLARL